MLIGYARVSTEDQNLSLQIDALKKAGCQKIYQEKISSTKAKRPALEELLSHLRAGDTLIVWKLDRLGRSLTELIGLITKFSEHQINFKSLNENIDTITPTGQLVFHIFCALAEFERELIRQRTLAGLQAARARKQVLGRPKGLSKASQQKAQAAASLYRDGALAVRAICDHLHISSPTLYRYLKHENVTLKEDQPNMEILEVG
ncbi:MAG TPA: resolvase [Amoebophilaceae bacterium]|nr:resolvase [Amoebophilaceae bacterium]